MVECNMHHFRRSKRFWENRCRKVKTIGAKWTNSTIKTWTYWYIHMKSTIVTTITQKKKKEMAQLIPGSNKFKLFYGVSFSRRESKQVYMDRLFEMNWEFRKNCCVAVIKNGKKSNLSQNDWISERVKEKKEHIHLIQHTAKTSTLTNRTVANSNW